MSHPASVETVEVVLNKVLSTGKLGRIPRNPMHRDVVLAMLCRHMQRRHPYAERELNDFLKRALAGLRADVDHVTCRRYLVDLGFVRRDRAGRRYLLNYPRLESTLSPGAMEAAESLVQAALTLKKRSRAGNFVGAADDHETSTK